MQQSDSFESKVVQFPKEFHKKLSHVLDRRYYTVLLASIIVHAFIVVYFLMNPLPESVGMRSISRIQQRIAQTLKENEAKLNERLARFELTESRPVKEEPEAKTTEPPKTSGTKERAQKSAGSKPSQESAKTAGRGSGRRGRTTESIESAVGSKGILGLLTSSGSAASGEEVEDILGQSSRSQSDLDEALSNLSGIKTGEAPGGSGDSYGNGAGVKGGRNQGVESIDDLVSGLGKTKSSSFSRTGDLVVVNESPLIEKSGDKGIVGRNQDQVQAVVVKHNNSIQYCYERELKRNPSLKGKVVIRFTITPEGTVKDVEVVSSNLNNRRVEQCIVSRVRRWTDFGAIDPKYGDTTIRQVYAFGY